ncbi:MAG: hypothetical protein ACHQQQ_03310 [Bacteroidota bacterium]
MKTLIDVIAAAYLPRYFLFKNLEFNIDQGSRKICSFEWAKPGESVVELKNLIPKPIILPADPKQLNYFLNYHGWSDVKEFEAQWDKQMFEFDDSLMSFQNGVNNWETRSKDYLMYGESYTILWLCFPDGKKVFEYVREFLKKITNNFTNIQHHHVDTFFDFTHRMYFFPEDIMLDGSVWNKIQLMFDEEMDPFLNDHNK